MRWRRAPVAGLRALWTLWGTSRGRLRTRLGRSMGPCRRLVRRGRRGSRRTSPVCRTRRIRRRRRPLVRSMVWRGTWLILARRPRGVSVCRSMGCRPRRRTRRPGCLGRSRVWLVWVAGPVGRSAAGSAPLWRVLRRRPPTWRRGYPTRSRRYRSRPPTTSETCGRRRRIPCRR